MDETRSLPPALSLLHSQRPRDVNWFRAAALLFGDWGTSRLYVLGLAFLFAGRTSFWLIFAMSGLILAVGWAYSQICRIYPDGGGVYTAARSKSRTLAVVGALLLFADYTVTASLSVLDGFHYFGLPLRHQVEHDAEREAKQAGDDPRGGQGRLQHRPQGRCRQLRGRRAQEAAVHQGRPLLPRLARPVGHPRHRR